MTRDEEKSERRNLLREGVLRLRSLFLPSEGLHIGENRLVVKKDASGNQDPYWQRQDGTEDNLTGEILFARATSNLTLSTSAQSIVGDGDSSKVRLLLPTIGDWLIAAVCDLNLTVAGAGISFGELFVNDSGTAETGVAVYIPDAAASERATVSQQWKVTTTAVDTPVELKAKKENAGGTALALATHTTLMATRGGGGGTSVASSDHGNLTGLGDAADHDWALLKDGTRAGSTGSAQDFGATGIKADVVAESTPAAGVTIDSVLLKDGVVTVGDVAFDDATSDPLIDADAASDGVENSVARKDHAHPKHHAKYLNSEAVTAAKTVKLDDFTAPDDNADLNATTSKHGLLLKLGGGTTNFLRADGAWAAPAGGAGGIPNAPDIWIQIP